MLDLVAKGFACLWMKKEWRPQLFNATLMLAISIIFFFYVNFKHDQAIAGIHEQASATDRVLEKMEHISARVDDIYRILAGNL